MNAVLSIDLSSHQLTALVGGSELVIPLHHAPEHPAWPKFSAEARHQIVTLLNSTTKNNPGQPDHPRRLPA